MMPSISIILNTYNSARFLLETVDTVLNQTFQDFELIVIDDGSQDHSLALVSSVNDSRIKVFPYANAGIAASRNRGLQHATAEFVAFLDHDDLWHEKKLENQWQALKARPSAAFAYSWLKTIDESGDFIRTYPPVRHSDNAYEKLLVKNFLHTASNPLIRRKELIEIGGFDEAIYGADDWDVFIRLATNSPIAVSPHHEIYYRIVKGSGSANVDKIEQGCLQVVHKAFQAAPLKFQSIKPRTLGTIYQYLCFRTLEEMADRRSGFKSLHYWQKSYKNNSKLWGIVPTSKVFLKAILVMLFSPIVISYILSRINRNPQD
ncbi:MAG: glycosyltransferase family 2 protein [Leptolyngbyaceae cyanobacterium]